MSSNISGSSEHSFSDDKINIKTVEWDYNIPLLFNRFILQDYLKVITVIILFFILLGLFITVYDRINYGHFYNRSSSFSSSSGLQYALTFIGICILLTVIVTSILFRRGYSAHFAVDSKGAAACPTHQQYKTATKINYLLIILGILMRKPGAVGTGLISQSSQFVNVSWNEIFRVKLHPAQRVVALYNSWRRVLVLYCTEGNFDAVAGIAQEGVARTAAERERNHAETKKGAKRVASGGIFLIVMALMVSASPLIEGIFLAPVWALLAISILAAITAGGVKRFFGFLSLLLVTLTVVLMVFSGMEEHPSSFGLSSYHKLGSIASGIDIEQFIVSMLGLTGITVFAWRCILARDEAIRAVRRKPAMNFFVSAGIVLMLFISSLIGYAAWWEGAKISSAKQDMFKKPEPMVIFPYDEPEMKEYKESHNAMIEAFERYRNAPPSEKQKAYSEYKKAGDDYNIKFDRMLEKLKEGKKQF